MKIRPVGDELFHADIQTDRLGEANSRFVQCRLKAEKYVPKDQPLVIRGKNIYINVVTQLASAD